jgi:hypothetical protein
MKQHIVHFLVGTTTGWCGLSVTTLEGSDSVLTLLLKSSISLIIGCLSALFTAWINSHVKKNSETNINP